MKPPCRARVLVIRRCSLFSLKVGWEDFWGRPRQSRRDPDVTGANEAEFDSGTRSRFYLSNHAALVQRIRIASLFASCAEASLSGLRNDVRKTAIQFAERFPDGDLGGRLVRINCDGVWSLHGARAINIDGQRSRAANQGQEWRRPSLPRNVPVFGSYDR